MALLAPPPVHLPQTGPIGKAWVISKVHQNQKSLFGWHVRDPRFDCPEVTLAHVLAFKKQHQAMGFCGFLGRFNNTIHSWPNRILTGPEDELELLIAHGKDEIGKEIHKELEVNEVSLQGGFFDKLMINNIALDIVDDMTGPVMHTTVYTADMPYNVYFDNLEHLLRLQAL